jgi:hypothetical protein
MKPFLNQIPGISSKLVVSPGALIEQESEEYLEERTNEERSRGAASP